MLSIVGIVDVCSASFISIHALLLLIMSVSSRLDTVYLHLRSCFYAYAVVDYAGTTTEVTIVNSRRAGHGLFFECLLASSYMNIAASD